MSTEAEQGADYKIIHLSGKLLFNSPTSRKGKVQKDKSIAWGKNERNKREQIENKINKMEEACPNINNYIKCRLAQHTKTEAGSVDFKPAPITCCPQETDFAYDAIGKLKGKGEKKNLHHANANPRKQEWLSD